MINPYEQPKWEAMSHTRKIFTSLTISREPKLKKYVVLFRDNSNLQETPGSTVYHEFRKASTVA